MEDSPAEGFLPPEPAGPEPELGQRPVRSEPQTQWQQPQGGGPQPTPGQWQQPYAGAPQPPPGQWQQPPAGWQPPPPGWQQPQPQWVQAPHQPWAYPQEPDNNQAVTGFVLAMVSLGLWLLSFGLSSFLSIGLAVGGYITSRRGKRKLEAGETRKHRGLAQAGYVINLILIAVTTATTIFWAIFWILFATDADFRNDLEDGNNNSFGDNSVSTTVRLGAVAVRLGAALLG